METEILIIGGGIIGLAIAVELRLRQAKVTVLDRDFQAAATHAAAGMLAPGAEAIPPGDMLDLCRRSLSLYPGWTAKLEELTGINTGYWCCGILTPVYEDEGSWNSTNLSSGNLSSENLSSGNLSSTNLSSGNLNNKQYKPAQWLDKTAIHQIQSGLGKEVIGGYWYPEDGQVNNRSLARALLTAAKSIGVEIKSGVNVEGIKQQQGKVAGLQTNIGFLSAEHYVLATGAWSNQLLPLPVSPKKGQMLSLRVPESIRELPITRVLYGSDIYIIPRRERKIIVGATSENVGFIPENTPLGIGSLLQQATKLFPLLENYPIEEMWWGFRPTTPDELPILGKSACDNLTLATGHHRNGILLAPITASLIADLIWNQKSDALLEGFNYSRFFNRANSTPMLTQSSNFSNQVSNQVSNQLSPVSPKMREDIPLDTPLDTFLDTHLEIAGKTFTCRLMTGTGKYRTIEDMQQSIAASACEIVTVAVRRVQTNAPGHEGLAEALNWNRIWMLPNTAGCKTAEEAIRVARLGREMAKLLGQEDNNFVKLEVISDAKYLLPDPIGTLQAAEQLVKEGFAVLPYINADPILAQRLQEAGCATVMPLAAPIGSGQGLQTAANIQIIIENATVPVVVDAGIGSPSEAAQAMEMGADALLINSAIALAKNSPAMAKAMSMATIAGRMAFLAGRMPAKNRAIASSPLTGTIV